MEMFFFFAFFAYRRQGCQYDLLTIKNTCCVPIRLLILRPKSMYSFFWRESTYFWVCSKRV